MSEPEQKIPVDLDIVEKGTREYDSESPPSTAAPSEEPQAEFGVDGHVILIPQPSDDPNDPLNWSTAKKHVTLLIICYLSFFSDYGSSTGSITNLVQPLTWKPLTQAIINHALVGNLFMVGACGICVVILSNYFGRLPVLFWYTCMALITVIWAAAAPSFKSFMAARILQGFFAPVAQAGGLMWVKDIFFVHEHPRKINIWVFFVLFGPYLGPMMASFIVWKTSWRYAYWVTAIMTGLGLIAAVLFLDETYYNRKIPTDQQPERKSRWLRLIGVEQWQSRHQRNTFWQAAQRPIIVISKIPVLLITIYYIFTFGWSIGLSVSIATFLKSYYHFGHLGSALYFFTPMVAAVLAEITGHYVFDIINKAWVKRHGGVLEPETRLIPVWFATPLTILGVALLGVSLAHGWHYMFTAFAWGLFIYGMVLSTTAVNAYLLRAYPEASGEIAAWINFGRTLGGFIITYYELPWVKSDGVQKVMGIQAGCIGASFFLIVILQIFGKQLRQFSGKVEFLSR